MSRGENGRPSDRRRRRRGERQYFVDRLADNFDMLLYKLVRPFRHLSRKLQRGFYHAADSTDQSLNKLSDPFRRLGYRLRRLGMIFRPIDDRLQDISDNIDTSIYNKRKEKYFKRMQRRQERWARFEDRMPEVVHQPDYLPGVERLRIILMFLMCIDLFGSTGGLLSMFCGFVPIAFFILSGYLVLRESEHRSERIKRAIKRSAIVFGILAAVYFVLNLLYYRILGVNILPALAIPRFWFNFLVLNVWQFDIGGVIWYVQALLYAYIIIYFLDKWKLLKFDWLIVTVLIIFTVITGELCGVIRWEWHGYSYIPGNFLTRALPYILLGSIIRRKQSALFRFNRLFYSTGIVLGCLLMIAELFLLAAFGAQGYYGHLIGMPIVAVSVCMLAFGFGREEGFERVLGMSRWHTNCIYYLCQPVSVLLVLLLTVVGNQSIGTFSGFISIMTFAVCFLISWLIAVIGRKISAKKPDGNKANG
ncbi:MAG: acyltransferase [Eubacteriales bacterium]|nr:acyltransferase [Eubacteriales bacterium]